MTIRIMSDHAGTLKAHAGQDRHPIWEMLRKAGVITLYDLWELCAVCAVGIPSHPRRELEEGAAEGEEPERPLDSNAREVRARFERFCILAAGYSPSRKDTVKNKVEPNSKAKAAPAASRERVPGMNDYCARLEAKYKNAQRAPEVDPRVDTIQESVCAQVRTFLRNDKDYPGVVSGNSILKWWRSRARGTFPDLIPGVLLLLSIPVIDPPCPKKQPCTSWSKLTSGLKRTS